MTLALLARQNRNDPAYRGEKRNKWKLFRAVCEARSELGIGDRALTVLDALLSFYPHDELGEDDNLIVFPSNEQLCLRARGMASATLRRHLSALVEADIIQRKDSPNGKRYARRNRSGKIDDAFGFSLAPLLARANEIEATASAIVEEREKLRRARELVSLVRRDITKLLVLAKLEQVSADLGDLQGRYDNLASRLPRKPSLANLAPIAAAFASLRDELCKLLENHRNAADLSGNEPQIEQHKQDSKTKFPFEYRPVSICVDADNSTCSAKPASDVSNGLATAVVSVTTNPQRPASTARVPDISTILRACPQIIDYGPGGTIRNWADLASAASVVRTMLAITPACWSKAVAILGMEAAITAIACILERAEDIRQPGAYLTDLARRAQRQEFSVQPMLFALLRQITPSAMPATARNGGIFNG